MKEYFENIELDIHGVRLPEIKIPDEDYKRCGISNNVDNAEFLKQLCRTGYKERLANGGINKLREKEYGERVKYELKTISELGFTDYILLVWDVINYCHKNDIPVGAGRGSAAGSLVLYLIGVTNIDPIEMGLFFERFISKARAKSQVVDGIQYIDGDLAPDVDLDICHEKRELVVKYLEEKYAGKFCKLPTCQTLQSKVLIKECGKIISEYPEDHMKEVSKWIPTLFGKVHSIDKARKESERFENFCNENPEIVKTATKLQELIKHRGAHASAYLVSYNNLNEFMPCEAGNDGEILSSPDMHYAQKECIKLDLLGLDSVTLVDRICKRIGIKQSDIDPNDYETIYSHLQDPKCPYGLFQISGDANFRVVKDIKPKNLLDLAAVVALARPGAIHFVDDYVNNNKQDFGDPILADILKDSNGILIYQEQLMAIANRFFGFTLEDAEIIRRGVGKKKRDVIEEWEPKIRERGKEKGISEEIVNWYWNTLSASADYSFNKSHAVAYGYLSALTVYLKFNYPQEFFLEAIRILQHKPKMLENMALLQHELALFGIKLLPPDLVKSDMDFQIEGKNLRYGLAAIKGISDKSLCNVQDFIDKETANKFEVFQAAKEAKLNIGVFSALIQAGALSSMGDNRPLMVLEAQTWGLLTDKERLHCLKVGEAHGWNLLSMVKNILEWKDEKGKNVARSTRFETIKKKYEPYKNIYMLNKKYPDFASWAYEKKLLGYSYTTTLKEVFKEDNPQLQNILTVSESVDERDNVEIIGEVLDIRKGVSKSGEKYLKWKLLDESGVIDCMMYGDKKLDAYLEHNKRPEDDNILLVQGQKGTDIVWVNRMAIQDYKIYLKLSDLKDKK